VADARPSVLFLGSTYAGHAIRFANLQQHGLEDPRIRGAFHQIHGWNPRGTLERLPLIPDGLKGRVRAVVEARPMATLPRPDVIWTSGREELAAYAPAQRGPWRRPIIFDLDATDAQLESMARHYFHRAPKSGLRQRLSRMQERLIWSPVTLFTPWSNWAADGLRAEKIAEERIRVAPPGVSLDDWRPTRPTTHEGPLRLVFVGGDFVRKGGTMLLDVFRTFSPAELSLDIVTREEVARLPEGARLHRAEANSAELRALYSRAELFVLPTLADCFGIATIEAMASGLPVMVSDVGGARDIVDPGATGWLIEPSPQSLAASLRAALAHRDVLPDMGQRARATTEERFNSAVNDRLVIDWCVELAERGRHTANSLGAVPSNNRRA
jgi:glycosyltransferase involved in cell wall biosynthesis